MAWEFSAECGECGHHWVGLTWYERLGPTQPASQYFYCPKCFVHVVIPETLNRFAFVKWMKANANPIATSRVLQHTVRLFEKSMRWFHLQIPTLSIRRSLYCPPCERPLVAGTINDCPIICPNCGSEFARATCVSHVSLVRVDEDD